ncbi:M23 family metallopeptidase [Actinokineospora guangxiensis]|uniref:M23 family metallopeptidase n=1 Tax=Actinokineospora guangxiensis TaxID=1490288 RepID=A0ABW0ET29_9PSEU
MTSDQPRFRLLFIVAAIVLMTVAAPGLGLGLSAAPGPPASSFTWPLDPPPTVSRPFEQPPGPYAAGHRGVDLVAEPGARVLAAASGTVVFAGRVVDRGVVSIRHGPALRSTYEPLEPSVGVGEEVAAGQVIGTLLAGHRGCPGPACLHWGLRRGGAYLDPLLTLTPLRVRLLPH